MTFGLAVFFEKFETSLVLPYFFYLKQFNENKVWYPPKCVPFTLFNFSSLSYVTLALSSAVTNLPNKTIIFHDFQRLTIKFHDFPNLENEIHKIPRLSRFSMTCTNPVGDIFPDAELLHFKGFKFASPA